MLSPAVPSPTALPIPALPPSAVPAEAPYPTVAAAADVAIPGPNIADLLPSLGMLGGMALAAFGALAAACLVGYSPTRLAELLANRGRQELAAELDRRDTEYLVVASLYSTCGWVLSLVSLSQAVPPSGLPWAMLVFVGVMVLLAGSLPTAVAQVRAERALLLVLPAMRPTWFALRWPLVLPLMATTRLVLRSMGLQRPRKTDPAEVKEQVLAAVADAVADTDADDSLPDSERTWIGNIVGLKDLQVSTLMTPRPDIVAFPESLSLGDAVQKALEHGFSRYPVYRDRIDEVVGVFNVKDALALAKGDRAAAAQPVRTMLREPLFVPETTGAAQLLKRFQAGNQHLAVVIDEYGTTVGIVTVEDVVEQIVGDIGDEYDPPAAATDATAVRVVEAGRVLELPARTVVAEVNELLGTSLPESGDWETVAGLVIARLNHIPTVGETVVVDNVEFRVLQADDRRVHLLRATLLSPEVAEERG